MIDQLIEIQYNFKQVTEGVSEKLVISITLEELPKQFETFLLESCRTTC